MVDISPSPDLKAIIKNSYNFCRTKGSIFFLLVELIEHINLSMKRKKTKKSIKNPGKSK